jgi:hypothetical protein
LKGIFENELNHCIKSIKSYSKAWAAAKELGKHDHDEFHEVQSLSTTATTNNNSKSKSNTIKKAGIERSSFNAKRRLAISQLRQVWEKYGPHLPPSYLMFQLVETGETLLGIDGFHDVAESLCFSMYLDKALALYDDGRGARRDGPFSVTSGSIFNGQHDGNELSAVMGRVSLAPDRSSIKLSEASRFATGRESVTNSTELVDQQQQLQKQMAESNHQLQFDQQQTLEEPQQLNTQELQSQGQLNGDTPPVKVLERDQITTSQPISFNASSQPDISTIKCPNTSITPQNALPPTKQQQEQPNLVLRLRCEYGQSICRFLNLLEIDPTLKSPTVRQKIQNVMKDIRNIMERCAEMLSRFENEGGSKNEPEGDSEVPDSTSLKWLVLSGTFHLRVITDRLSQSGKHWIEVRKIVFLVMLVRWGRGQQLPYTNYCIVFFLLRFQIICWLAHLYSKPFVHLEYHEPYPG